MKTNGLVRTCMSMTCLLTVATLASACTLTRMQVPPPLAKGATTVPVLHEDNFFDDDMVAFGQWKTRSVDNGWTRSQSTSGFFTPGNVVQAEQGYRIQLDHDGKLAWEIACQKTMQSLQQSLGALRMTQSDQHLRCAMRKPGEKVAGSLVMHMGRRDNVGQLRWGERTLKVAASHQAQGGQSFDAVGFVFSESGKMLAALQTVNNPILWLSNSADAASRVAIATAVTAIVLYDPLSDDRDRSD